jgi:predicted AAA+ superfamily ATPase
VYTRILEPPSRHSFLLFGPRGTGKTTWLRTRFPDAPFFDLLDAEVQWELTAFPRRLGERIPPAYRGWVVIDEVQKVPALLDEVHRLIEGRRLRFALTGSNARKLKRPGVNLLAGRAITLAMHPLTCAELGSRFDLGRSLRFGQLPVVHGETDPKIVHAYLRSYASTYLRTEVQQEGLTRNLAAFARFLEAASFSHASVLNVSAVARDSGVERKVVEDYFSILEDLLLAVRLPVFTRRAKRAPVAHPKLYLFDVGVFRALRPRGPLDSDEEIAGAACETLLLQELRALNDYRDLGWQIFYWRTASGLEVDFVLYGERGLRAFEVKRTARLRSADFRSLNAFVADYPMARAWLVYGGTRRYHQGPIEVIPLAECLRELGALIE